MSNKEPLKGALQVSWSVPNKPILEFRLRVVGDAGTLEVTRREIRLTLERPWEDFGAGDHRIGAADVPNDAAYDFSPDYGGSGYYVESAKFLGCCAARRPYEIDFAEGVRVERALSAIYRSSDADGEEKTATNPH